MAKPNRNISIHKCFFSYQAGQVKEAMRCLIQKNSLNAEDIQAMKVLIGVYENLINPTPEIYEHGGEEHSNDRPEEGQFEFPQ